MADLQLIDSLAKLLKRDGAVAAMTTIDAEGHAATVLNAEVFLTPHGTFLYREYLESSTTNRNLLHALWFEKRAILAVAAGEKALDVHGVPTIAHVAGPLFQEHYAAAQAADPETDLATVWEIRIDDIVEVSPGFLRRRQDAERPFFRHLDRLLVPAPQQR